MSETVKTQTASSCCWNSGHDITSSERPGVSLWLCRGVTWKTPCASLFFDEHPSFEALLLASQWGGWGGGGGSNLLLISHRMATVLLRSFSWFFSISALVNHVFFADKLATSPCMLEACVTYFALCWWVLFSLFFSPWNMIRCEVRLECSGNFILMRKWALSPICFENDWIPTEDAVPLWYNVCFIRTHLLHNS